MEHYWVEACDQQGHAYYYRKDDPRITQREKPVGVIVDSAGGESERPSAPDPMRQSSAV